MSMLSIHWENLKILHFMVGRQMPSLKRKRYQAQLYSKKKPPVTLSSKAKENLHLSLTLFSGKELMNFSVCLETYFQVHLLILFSCISFPFAACNSSAHLRKRKHLVFQFLLQICLYFSSPPCSFCFFPLCWMLLVPFLLTSSLSWLQIASRYPVLCVACQNFGK